ncbi:hypothetical protein J1N35_012286 [Gossypium stocksii]|uniref:RNase H type-1 domain-containing protein n=1 Tax=Gossypium stocksii TaxID=47602 RepID=A0A9D3W520_9ROSI|nr:hypothetical protein J1N35_012286 [Gossypium stocksii]
MASAVSSLTEKKDDGNTNSIPIENVITAVQVWLTSNFVVFSADSHFANVVDTILAKARDESSMLSPHQSNESQSPPLCRFLGWHKLNTGDSSVGYSDKDGAKSSIRSHGGHWVRGSVRHMELWALKDALHFAKSLDIVNMKIQLNATNVICLIKNIVNKSVSNRLFSSLFREFQQRTMKRAFNETSVLMRSL